jgi:hypothetical protein
MIVLSLALACQGCATVMNGSRQAVPVTSSPPGASILVDGKLVGHTPLHLRLKRDQSLTIRIESDGYNPAEIRVTSGGISSGLPILLDVAAGGVLGWYGFPAIVGRGDNAGAFGMIGGAILGMAIFIAVDEIVGGLSGLSPATIQVELTRKADRSRPDVLCLDSNELQRLTWIRIHSPNADTERPDLYSGARNEVRK